MLERRYVNLGPAEVDIGRGSIRPERSDSRLDRCSQPGDEIVVDGRQLRTAQGKRWWRASGQKTDVGSGWIQRGAVSGILMRSREQSQAEFLKGVKVAEDG